MMQSECDVHLHHQFIKGRLCVLLRSLRPTRVYPTHVRRKKWRYQSTTTILTTLRHHILDHMWTLRFVSGIFVRLYVASCVLSSSSMLMMMITCTISVNNNNNNLYAFKKYLRFTWAAKEEAMQYGLLDGSQKK